MGLKETLRQHGLQPKKKFGQNFLQDPHLLAKIISFADLTPADVVLEIGPGMGTLTKAIADMAKETVAIEIDQALFNYLQKVFVDQAHVHLIQGNALEMNLDALVAQTTGAEHYVVIANLPYYITTPLILHSLCDQQHAQRLVMMVQKEVAERLVAAPGSKAYGAISVAVQYRAQVSIEMTIAPGAFYPPPKVTSAVLLLQRYERRPHQAQDDVFFAKTVRQAFAQRRKTLRNSLSAGFNKQVVDEALHQADICGSQRAETLSVADFVALSDALQAALAKT